MINTVLLAAITGILIGKFIIEPLIEIYSDRKFKNILMDIFEDDDWEVSER